MSSPSSLNTDLRSLEILPNLENDGGRAVPSRMRFSVHLWWKLGRPTGCVEGGVSRTALAMMSGLSPGLLGKWDDKGGLSPKVAFLEGTRG